MGKKIKKIKRLKTGIRGLDEVLNGGMPIGRNMLVSGHTGSGKTMLLNEFIHRGIKDFDQKGVFVTFEEPPTEIIENVRGLGWDYEALIRNKKLVFVDFTDNINSKQILNRDFDLTPIKIRIKDAVDRIGASRVVLDSIGAFLLFFQEKELVREVLTELFKLLGERHVTSLVSAELVNGNTRFDVEEFVSSGVIRLSTHIGQNSILRKLSVKKMRGVSYRSGKVRFDISDNGIKVYPKIPLFKEVEKTSFKDRLRFGIDLLDDALSGGIPRGHILLIGGNTGTGKTTMALQFLLKGIENGENGIWVAMEESVPQIKKTAESHGWQINDDGKDQKISFIHQSLIDITPDALLYKIINEVMDTKAKRIVIDSISSMESAIMDRNDIRDFLIQLSNYCKSRGITVVLNYLVSSIFGASNEQLLGSIESNAMRLSSVVDAIILLRYVERDQKVEKLLNILKLRGSDHDKSIFKYNITKQGIRLGKRFSG